MKWRLPLAFVSGILLVWGALPFLIARIRGVGVITPVVLGTLGLLSATVWAGSLVRLVRAVRCAGRGVQLPVMLAAALAAILVLLFFVASALMIAGASKAAPSDMAVTVIVPGAQIHHDRPSLMLADRLDAAAAFLNAHPDAVCVVSGGQGADEQYSEAQVMRQYLIACGVAEERVFLEDASTNTLENMRFTQRVIAQNGLPQRVVIATQEFHQYRSAAYARQSGLTPIGTATCGTPWYLFLCFWVREFAGICRMWLLGY